MLLYTSSTKIVHILSYPILSGGDPLAVDGLHDRLHPAHPARNLAARPARPASHRATRHAAQRRRRRHQVHGRLARPLRPAALRPDGVRRRAGVHPRHPGAARRRLVRPRPRQHRDGDRRVRKPGASQLSTQLNATQLNTTQLNSTQHRNPPVRKPWPAGQIWPAAHFRVARMAVSTTQN